MRIVVVLVVLALALILAPLLVAAPPMPAAANRVDVLVIEHTPDGPVERTGFVSAWRYTATSMLLEFVPDGDELFRSGFDPPP